MPRARSSEAPLGHKCQVGLRIVGAVDIVDEPGFVIAAFSEEDEQAVSHLIFQEHVTFQLEGYCFRHAFLHRVGFAAIETTIRRMEV